MTKSPTRESPQANEEPPPRQRNIYDYDGEYEFPTVQHWTPDFAGRRDVRHSRASHDFDRHQLTANMPRRGRVLSMRQIKGLVASFLSPNDEFTAERKAKMLSRLTSIANRLL